MITYSRALWHYLLTYFFFINLGPVCFSSGRTSAIKAYCAILTYLLTPRSTVLLEKLTGSQLIKKFPTFYGIRRFITAYTSARQLSISWASLIQSILSHPPSSHLRPGLPSGHFPSGFPHQNPVYASPLLHTCYMPRPSHSSRFYHPNNIGWTI
jgi:hypothetical protein